MIKSLYVLCLRFEEVKRQKVLYWSQTTDLKKRFHQHNKVSSVATKSEIPWQLIYYEAYTAKALALEREKRLKHHGRGSWRRLKERIGFGRAT